MSNYDNSVVIIEPDFKLVKLYQLLVTRLEGVSLIGTYGGFGEAYRKMQKQKPKLVILSVYLNYDHSLQDIEQIFSTYSRTSIVALVDFIDPEWVVKAMECGVISLVLKSDNLCELERALESTIAGGSYISPLIVRTIINNNRKNISPILSDREVQVMNLLSEGKSYSMIAHELSISRDTSKSHIKNIYTKLRVSNKAEAIKKARIQKII